MNSELILFVAIDIGRLCTAICVVLGGIKDGI